MNADESATTSALEPPRLRATVYTGRWPQLPDGGTFSPTTSTLVTGTTEAVLIDAQYLKADVQDLGDLIERTGKQLTTIFVTHGHADHYLGFVPLLAPFGIRVAIIEPGITKSAIFARNVDSIHASPDYEPHLRRMAQFYAAGYPQATDPFEVAKVVHHAIHTDKPTLRHVVSWGGAELVAGRSRMSDEQRIALGAIHDDDAYYQAYADTFGLDISVGAG